MKGEPTTHYLKTWPKFFEDVWSGVKRFEYRKNDRNFQVGDMLALEEYDPEKGYLERRIKMTVTRLYTSKDVPGLPSDYVLMVIESL